jgi:hypothetical protein
VAQSVAWRRCRALIPCHYCFEQRKRIEAKRKPSSFYMSLNLRKSQNFAHKSCKIPITKITRCESQRQKQKPGQNRNSQTHSSIIKTHTNCSVCSYTQEPQNHNHWSSGIWSLLIDSTKVLIWICSQN